MKKAAVLLLIAGAILTIWGFMIGAEVAPQVMSPGVGKAFEHGQRHSAIVFRSGGVVMAIGTLLLVVSAVKTRANN